MDGIVSQSHRDYTHNINMAVTNDAEKGVFLTLLIINVVFLMLLGVNFANIAKWSLNNKTCSCYLYCVNSNLYLLTASILWLYLS